MSVLDLQTDWDRWEFLDALDCSDAELNDFESQFVDGHMKTYHECHEQGWDVSDIGFSEKQRKVIEQMYAKYYQEM